jgi:3-oxoacyl-[acyl-carrier protein] reductase
VAAEDGVSVEEKRASLVEDSALKVPSTPEDVANLALFLASDQAKSITGQSIAVDAGHVMMG